MEELSIPPEIRSFLEGLLQDAGMTTLDDVMREEMIKELFVRLDSFITSTIIDSLPTDRLDEFTQMSESGKSQEELQSYLSANIPNAGEVFQNAFTQFRTMYLGNVNTARALHNEEIPITQDTPEDNTVPSST